MKKDRKRIVIALGGNAIKLPHQEGTYGEQLANVRSASRHILDFIRRGFGGVIEEPIVDSMIFRQNTEGLYAGVEWTDPQEKTVWLALHFREDKIAQP